MCPVSVGMAGVPAVEVWIVCAREVVKRRGKGRLRPEYEVFWVFLKLCPLFFIIIILLQLSQFFSLCPPAPSPPQAQSHSQSLHRCPCPWVIHTCFLTSPFPFFPPLFSSCLPSGHCPSVPCFCVSGSVLLVSLFCSLDSSYK